MKAPGVQSTGFTSYSHNNVSYSYMLTFKRFLVCKRITELEVKVAFCTTVNKLLSDLHLAAASPGSPGARRSSGKWWGPLGFFPGSLWTALSADGGWSSGRRRPAGRPSLEPRRRAAQPVAPPFERSPEERGATGMRREVVRRGKRDESQKRYAHTRHPVRHTVRDQKVHVHMIRPHIRANSSKLNIHHSTFNKRYSEKICDRNVYICEHIQAWDNTVHALVHYISNADKQWYFWDLNLDLLVITSTVLPFPFIPMVYLLCTGACVVQTLGNLSLYTWFIITISWSKEIGERPGLKHNRQTKMSGDRT